MIAPVGTASRSAHIVYYDWLKFLVVYGIVVFHASLPFANGSWLLESRDRSVILSAFAAFTFPWGIPLLFLLSGAGAYFGLRSRTAATFLQRRFMRLGLPLVAGIALLSPMQAYFVRGVPPRNLAGAIAYYPHFLRSLRPDWTPEWLGRYGYHLWFLGYLLAITAITLPLLEWLRGERGQRVAGSLAAFSSRRGGIFVFFLPLAVSQVLLRNRFPSYQDWADVATYTMVFLAGYLMASDAAFTIGIRRNAAVALMLGIVSSLAVGTMPRLGALHLAPVSPSAAVLYHAIYGVFWSLNIWSWSITVLWIGDRWLSHSSRLLAYGSESALPVYIISHPVLVVIGSYVVASSMPLWPRFLLLVVLTFAVTLGIYEFGIRRWNPTRFLFGLTSLPPRAPVAGAKSRFPHVGGLLGPLGRRGVTSP
jgi:acyltransferase-like protein